MFYSMVIGLLVVWMPYYGYCEISSSLLTTNASIAIIIDKEYLGTEFDGIRLKIDEFLIYARREILRNGGVNVYYFTWTAINMKRDFAAILSITSCSKTWALFRASRNENLLHIAISEQDCPRLPESDAITIPIIIKGQETPQLLLDLRTMGIYKWKQLAIIYDNNISNDLLTRIIRSITKQANRIDASGISLIKLFNKTVTLEHTKEKIKTKLSSINPSTVGKNFLVIIGLELVDDVMECAKELNLIDALNQWLFVISNTNSRIRNLKKLENLLREGDNVAFIYNHTSLGKNCMGGLECHIEEILSGFTKSLNDAILNEQEMSAQISEEEWEAVRPTKIERTKYLLNKIKQFIKKTGICDNCTRWNIETGETWGREYQSVYTAETKSNENISVAEILSVGTWRPSDGPSMTDQLFPHIAHGFRRKTLPLVSFHNPPWQILKLNESGDVLEYKGLVFDIIKELAKNLNFTYTIEVIKTNNWKSNITKFQSSYTNDSIEFMEQIDNLDVSTYKIPQQILEMVHNKSVAMGACAFTITEANKQLINFTDPISIQFYTFVVARPKQLGRALLFISPFASSTWLCLAATVILIGPILYLVHKLSPVYEYNGIRSKGGLATIQNCIWYIYGALLQQGGMHLPQADSARIIVGAWWLVVLVIGTSYCGNLVAFLTFPKNDIPITTLDELINHKDTVTWSFAKNTFFEAQLKATNDITQKTIYKESKDIKNKRQMISKIKEGKHVYIDWKIKLQFIMKQQFDENGACTLDLGTDEFLDEQIGMIIAPDSPYLKKINAEIKKLHQVGLIQKWLEDYLPKRDRCSKRKRFVEVNNHTVNLDDMQGIFFLLAFGLLISIVLLLIEKFRYKKTQKVNAKRSPLQPFTT